jgi:putative transposase
MTRPRVTDNRTDPVTGERKRFSSAILPAWARKTPKITEVVPLSCICTGCRAGTSCPRSASSSAHRQGCRRQYTRLTEQWKAEQRAVAERDMSVADYVHLRADGIHVNIRLEEHKLCLLVMIGVRADGRNGLIALADGYRVRGVAG